MPTTANRYGDDAAGEDEDMSLRLRRAETVGRPIGSAAFLSELGRAAGWELRGRRLTQINIWGTWTTPPKSYKMLRLA